MEQLNNPTINNSRWVKWYRFPIMMVDRKLKDIYEEDEIPKDKMEESWVDIRLDSIVAVEPYYEGNDLKITGTLISTTSGDSYGVELKPSSVRKLLNYEPIKLENEFKIPSV